MSMRVSTRPAIPGTAFTEAQNEDGTPHFAYYAQPQRLSFIWDGKSQHIQICPEGYGEPAQWLIPAPDLILGPPPPFILLQVFQKVCDEFLLTEWQKL